MPECIPFLQQPWTWLGRRDPQAPARMVWQGTEVRVSARTESLELLWEGESGEAHFAVEVGTETEVVSVRAGETVRRRFVLQAKEPLPVRVRKRSEADAGWARFLGATPEAGLALYPPKPDVRPLWLIFGDSITAGACNEDGAADQWDQRRTHNALRSYGALAAEALGFAWQNVAVSGMGIEEGYVTVKAREVWNKVLPRADAAAVAPGVETPRWISINWGENDDSWTKNQGLPFPGGYTDGYVAVVRAIRAQYPHARILCLRGGMGGGALSEPLAKAWTQAVQTLQAEDSRLHPYVFGHWSELHPRVSDHQRMADELVAWIQRQPWGREGSLG